MCVARQLSRDLRLPRLSLSAVDGRHILSRRRSVTSPRLPLAVLKNNPEQGFPTFKLLETQERDEGSPQWPET